MDVVAGAAVDIYQEIQLRNKLPIQSALVMNANEAIIDIDDMEGGVVEVGGEHVMNDVETMSSMTATDSNSSSESSSSGESDAEVSTDEEPGGSADDTNDNDVNGANYETEMNAMEPAQLTEKGPLLQLPRGLCEHASIFNEFFKPELWTEELSADERDKLHELLPRFHDFLEPNEAAMELDNTVYKLFANYELQRFDRVPLVELQKNLEAGNYRPDVLVWRRSITKSKRREQRFRVCERISNLAKQLFISREKLLKQAYKLAPDEPLRSTLALSKRFNKDQRLQTILSDDMKVWSIRGRKRYHKTMQQLTKDFALTDEENEDDEVVGPAEMQMWREEEQYIVKSVTNFCSTSASANDRCIYDTFFKRVPDIPDDEAMRVKQYENRRRTCNRNIREILKEHKRRKLIKANAPEFETTDIRLRDVCGRAQVGGDENFKKIVAMRKAAAAARKAKLKASVAEKAATATAAGVSQSKSVADNLNSTAVLVPFTAVTTLKAAAPPGILTTALSTQKVHNVVSMSEPPALVPIQPLPAEILASKQIRNFDIASLSGNRLSEVQKNLISNISNSSNGNSGGFDLDDVVPFDINDFDVDLQQEEVETYDGPPIPGVHQIASNSTTLPLQFATNTSGIPTLTLPQQLQQQQQQSIPNLPKLKPLTTNISSKLNKSVNNTKINAIKQQQQLFAKNKSPINVSKANAASSGQISLRQESQSCFFSLIRDIFCATPNHRMKCDELKRRIDSWLANPITALNEWFGLADSWSNLVQLAVEFLSGEFHDLPEEYVPYIEYKTAMNIYQWIGAGRDTDARLTNLCNFWLQRCRSTPSSMERPGDGLHIFTTASPTASIIEKQANIGSVGITGLTPSAPPPPRCPTTWTVRPATVEEINEFQRQERERFSNPHRAYTYRLYGYESVVGPIKSVNSPALNKARGHLMMIGDRPNYVTILSLVRDAIARLPNGEGTRAEIAELLKCSQYINRDTSENTLQSVVSGALDRMHTEPDPSVRYESKRKVWIYLHRNRSVEDFERMHQEQQPVVNANKPQQALINQKKAVGHVVGNAIAGGSLSPAVASRKQKTTVKYVAGNISNEAVATTSIPTSNTAPLVLPALVPAKSVMLTNNTHQQQTQQQRSQSITKQTPPVPPLKYNIPPATVAMSQQQQQQKSLLRTMQNVQQQRQTTAVKRSAATPNSSSMASGATIANAKSLSGQPPQKVLRTVIHNVSSNNASSNNKATVVNNGVTNLNKQVTYTLTKTQNASIQQSATPIAANPSSMSFQGTHINSNAIGSTDKTVESKILCPAYTMVGGKRVALNKPIIVNQIGPVNISQQQQQQQQQILNRIKMVKQGTGTTTQQQPVQPQNILSIGTSSDIKQQHQQQTNAQTIVIDPATGTANATALASENIVAGKPHQQQQIVLQQQSSAGTAKNLIRILPGVKNLINISPGVNTIDTNNGNIAQKLNSPGGPKIITQHIIGNTNPSNTNTNNNNNNNNANIVRNVITQSKQLTGISVISSTNGQNSEVSPTAGSSTILKMSPQAFNALQQKQGQHIIIKQGTTAIQKVPQQQQQQQQQQPQQHLVIGNTAIIAQSGNNPKVPRNIIVQQQQQQTSQQSINATTAVLTGKTINNKIQINATNLTPQQQRVLIQNLKQHQNQGQQQLNKSQVSRQQTVTILSPGAQQRATTGVPTSIATSTSAAITAPKQVAMVVSQPSGFNKIVKTTTTPQQQTQQQQAQQQQQQQFLNKANRSLNNSNTNSIATGQIISLDELLQQPNKRNSTGGSLLIGNNNSGQFTVVTQSPASRLITIGNTSENNSSAEATGNKIVTGATISTSSMQQVQQLINVVTPSQSRTTVTSGPIKVLSATGTTGNTVITPGNFSIANIQGKQVVFATKPTNVGNTVVATGTNTGNIKNIIPAGSNIIIGGQTIKLQGNQQIQSLGKVTANSITGAQGATSQQQQQQLQTVLMGNQILRVIPQTFLANTSSGGAKNQQQTARVVAAVASKTNTNTTNSTTIVTSSNATTAPKTLLLGSPTTQIANNPNVRLQTSAAITSTTTNLPNTPTKVTRIINTGGNNGSNTSSGNSSNNRLVFAVQGGGQILLSPSQFQGGTLNLKSLQNMKLVSLAQLPQQQTNIQQQKTAPTIIKAISTSNSGNVTVTTTGNIIQDGDGNNNDNATTVI